MRVPGALPPGKPPRCTYRRLHACGGFRCRGAPPAPSLQMSLKASELLKLHANVFHEPLAAIDGPNVELRGQSLPTLLSQTGGPPEFVATLPVTFEVMQQSLQELPRADTEPDGFFLITGHEESFFWRLNGHMHEHQGQMHRVELNGECPAATLDAVLRTMGWPEAAVVFQLVHEGVTLREPELRRWALAE